MVKKIRKRKQKDGRPQSKFPTASSFDSFSGPLYKDSQGEHAQLIEGVSTIFKTYSVNDIASSLFVSSIWLPNISSTLKHQLLAAVFASLRPEDFSPSDRISSYVDFKVCLEKFYPLLPNLPMFEDYLPETDWGTVKFYHKGTNYKIFYGSELSNVYDYLIMFQMLYVVFDKEYQEFAGRSPSEELHFCLLLQDAIINNINNQPIELNISPGHIEIPSEVFWENANVFYKSFNPEHLVNRSFLDSFSIVLGKSPRDILTEDRFFNEAPNGEVLPFLFIVNEGRYYPILPRRYSAILFDKWAHLFEKYYYQFQKKDKLCKLKIGAELHHYIKDRIRGDNLFHFVSAFDDKTGPHEIVFTSAFISKNRLILIYITNPHISCEQTENELKKIAPKINQAEKIIGTNPVTIALPLKRENVQFTVSPNGKMLEPHTLVIIPQAIIELGSITIPKELVGRIIFMDQFVGIIDELEEADTMSDYLDYLKVYEKKITNPFLGPLDKYGSFKDSAGILIDGASEADYIFIDPHWGSNMRYKSLSEFWQIFPENGFFNHPRSWKVTKETDNRIRLDARGFFGIAFSTRIEHTTIIICAPFDSMDLGQAKISKFLMECLEDAISRNKEILKNLVFFKSDKHFLILFFPWSLVRDNEKFKHLLHLQPNSQKWISDFGTPESGRFGIRIVFNEDLVSEAFDKTKDATVEIKLLFEMLNTVNNNMPDSTMPSVKAAIEKNKNNKPRFKLKSIKPDASFPENIDPKKPSNYNFKKARKRVAELARKINLTTGDYDLKDAEEKLNALRDAVVYEIDSEVKKYIHERAVPFLIERIDALNAEYERKTHSIEYSLEHEVDFDRTEDYSETHSSFIVMHNNYRYLIEKFVQIEPDGKEYLYDDEFKYLVALIDYLLSYYRASDCLHYNIQHVGIKVEDNFIVIAKSTEDWEIKAKIFGKEEADLKLGIIGTSNDKVISPRSTELLIDALNKAFEHDFGFAFKYMINFLHILSFWGDYNPAGLSTFYSASTEEIEKICLKEIAGITHTNIINIIDFLTLKKDDVVKVLGQLEPCRSLPVWEHKKRFARYNLKPLIFIKDKYYWGPYSARKAGIIWAGAPSSGTFPAELESPAVDKVLSEEKKLIEDALVMKTSEIVGRRTSYVETNRFLHKFDKAGEHPLELGDYDVLAYYIEKNVVLNIECKDILNVFCLKDAKRLREQLFGKNLEDKGYYGKAHRRHMYLTENLFKVGSALKWPIDPKNPPKIISIFLSRDTYWWTRFPPYDVEVIFLRIDMLDQFLQDL